MEKTKWQKKKSSKFKRKQCQLAKVKMEFKTN